MKRTLKFLIIGAGIVVLASAFYFLGYNDGKADKEPYFSLEAEAKETPPSPVKALSDRDVYYPGSEALKPDEMRVVALGTGMPNARPKQAAACWLVELGNGDKFLFDIGSGCHERLAAQKIPYDYLDKIFIGHLHVDHMGDLPTFWLGGTTMNRLTPLRVWGPKHAAVPAGSSWSHPARSWAGPPCGLRANGR